MAEDDEDDYVLIRDVLEEIHGSVELVWVRDGEELTEHLLDGQNGEVKKEPDLILLDLNMPRKDGRTALKEMRSDRRFRRIPVVILTTSDSERDILDTYDLGANSFIIKPTSYESFRTVMAQLTTYWFETVNLPPHDIRRHEDARPSA